MPTATKNNLYKRRFNKLYKFAQNIKLDIIIKDIHSAGYIVTKPKTKYCYADISRDFPINRSWRKIILDAPEYNSDLQDFVFVSVFNQLLHELGHYISASPKRRLMNDYGVPVSRDKEAVIDRTSAKWEQDDIKAQLTERYIAYKLGLAGNEIPYADYFDEYSIQSWWKRSGKKSADKFLKKYGTNV